MTIPQQQPVQSQKDYQRPTIHVEITAIGMITPIGVNVEMTAASVRSAVSSYRESAILNKQFNPMILSQVPEEALPALDDELGKQVLSSRQQRLLRLATPAIQQIADKFTEPVPLMLCGPEKLPGRRSVISDKFLQQLMLQTKAPIDLENSYVFPHGRAAGFLALESAMQLLESGSHRQVMVGGIDSFLDLYLLATLDAEDRIQAQGMMDAFVPGEAAAFLLLKQADSSSTVKIYPPGIADEPGHRYSKEPYKGEGLANAVSEALSITSDRKIQTVFSSFNGENFHAKEWGVAAIRNQHILDSDHNVIHPADCYGDIGAATAPVLMALAAIGIENGHYHKPALVWASSEMQHRASVLMG